MNRRLIVTTILVLVVLALGTLSAAAQLVSGPPIADAYVYQTSPDTNFNTNYLYVRGDTLSCTQTQVAYLRWDLTNLDTTKSNYAGIVLNANFLSGSSGTTQVTMYKVADDAWQEGTIVFNPASPNAAPARGEVLDAKTITATGLVTFNAPAILTYFEQEADGDNFASIALAMTGSTCGGTATTVRFDSAEPVTGGTAPALDIRTAGPPPNSVDMSSASAQRTSWPLYAGLGVVALGVVVGVVISRRRTA